MPPWSQQDIEKLIEGFQTQSLRQEDWTHEAHLVVAAHYLATYPSHDALIYLRSGIISLNISMGVENTPQRGYHETLTCFYHWAVEQFLLDQDAKLSLVDCCNRLLQSSLADKKLPLAFYSKDYLFTTYARAHFVTPDLQSLAKANLSFD